MIQHVPYWSYVVLPALLRNARTTYGEAMRKALAVVGCEDMPRSGMYVVGALSHGDLKLGTIITQMGVSKQAGGQLVDALVQRGYVERAVDPEDRRRFVLTLTDRGRRAAAAQAIARDAIDEELVERLGEDKVMHAREVLGTLIDLRREGADADQ
jgi:DNA-binding MarR family transcriptional regulator